MPPYVQPTIEQEPLVQETPTDETQNGISSITGIAEENSPVSFCVPGQPESLTPFSQTPEARFGGMRMMVEFCQTNAEEGGKEKQISKDLSKMTSNLAQLTLISIQTGRDLGGESGFNPITPNKLMEHTNEFLNRIPDDEKEQLSYTEYQTVESNKFGLTADDNWEYLITRLVPEIRVAVGSDDNESFMALLADPQIESLAIAIRNIKIIEEYSRRHAEEHQGEVYEDLYATYMVEFYMEFGKYLDDPSEVEAEINRKAKEYWTEYRRNYEEQRWKSRQQHASSKGKQLDPYEKEGIRSIAYRATQQQRTGQSNFY